MAYVRTQQNISLIPLTITQLAYGIKQLSKEQLEMLELELDEKASNEILKRGKEVWKDYKRGETLTLDDLKKDL